MEVPGRWQAVVVPHRDLLLSPCILGRGNSCGCTEYGGRADLAAPGYCYAPRSTDRARSDRIRFPELMERFEFCPVRQLLELLNTPHPGMFTFAALPPCNFEGSRSCGRIFPDMPFTIACTHAAAADDRLGVASDVEWVADPYA